MLFCKLGHAQVVQPVGRYFGIRIGVMRWPARVPSGVVVSRPIKTIHHILGGCSTVVVFLVELLRLGGSANPATCWALFRPIWGRIKACNNACKTFQHATCAASYPQPTCCPGTPNPRPPLQVTRRADAWRAGFVHTYAEMHPTGHCTKGMLGQPVVWVITHLQLWTQIVFRHCACGCMRQVHGSCYPPRSTWKLLLPNRRPPLSPLSGALPSAAPFPAAAHPAAWGAKSTFPLPERSSCGAPLASARNAARPLPRAGRQPGAPPPPPCRCCCCSCCWSAACSSAANSSSSLGTRPRSRMPPAGRSAAP